MTSENDDLVDELAGAFVLNMSRERNATAKFLSFFGRGVTFGADGL